MDGNFDFINTNFYTIDEQEQEKEETEFSFVSSDLSDTGFIDHCSSPMEALYELFPEIRMCGTLWDAKDDDFYAMSCLESEKKLEFDSKKGGRKKRKKLREGSLKTVCSRSNIFAATRNRSMPLPKKRKIWLDGYQNKRLKFLLQKELRQSDVGTLNRVVLPKTSAEAYLPPLMEKEGIKLTVTDLLSSHTWEMRYRFWPNNKSRMYVLENTGDFVGQNHLNVGDFLVLCQDDNEKVFIFGRKKDTPLDFSIEEGNSDEEEENREDKDNDSVFESDIKSADTPSVVDRDHFLHHGTSTNGFSVKVEKNPLMEEVDFSVFDGLEDIIEEEELRIVK